MMKKRNNKNKDEQEVRYRILYDAFYSINPKNVPWGYETHDSDLAYFIEQLTFKSNVKVLDAGCGNGKNSAYLAEKGFEIYGFDISVKAITVARKKVPLGHFIVADAKSLPYVDEAFDLIVDVGLLHCIPPDGWESFKREVFRILRTNGYYFLRAYHRPLGYPPEKPLFYENVDQSGRSYFERDPSCEQIPIWSFNIPQIRNFFREFKIKTQRYGPNRLLVLISKEK